MLLTLTTTHEPATDLDYLLHKNLARWNAAGPEKPNVRTTHANRRNLGSPLRERSFAEQSRVRSGVNKGQKEEAESINRRAKLCRS